MIIQFYVNLRKMVAGRKSSPLVATWLLHHSSYIKVLQGLTVFILRGLYGRDYCTMPISFRRPMYENTGNILEIYNCSIFSSFKGS